MHLKDDGIQSNAQFDYAICPFHMMRPRLKLVVAAKANALVMWSLCRLFGFLCHTCEIHYSGTYDEVMSRLKWAIGTFRSLVRVPGTVFLQLYGKPKPFLLSRNS